MGLEVMKNNVRPVRKSMGMSGLELSRRVKMAPSTLSLVERGMLPAYPNWRRRISEALGLSEEELFPEIREDETGQLIS